MKFKRLLITASLLASCFVTGCQKKDNGYFKQYSFTAKANSEQIDKIDKCIDSCANSVSRVTRKHVAYTCSNLGSVDQSSDTVADIMNDSTNKNLLLLKTSNTSNVLTKEDGLEFKENRTEISQEWDTGVGYSIISTDTTVNKVTENRTQAYEMSASTKSEENKKNRILSLMELKNFNGASSVINTSIYQNKDGAFTYVKDNEVTRKSTLVDLGKSTKEYITETKKQVIYNINKDYRFTNYYTYTEESTNRDPDTGEWYDSVKVVRYSYTSLSFDYGTRANASVKELTNKAVAKKDILVGRKIRAYEITAKFSGGSYYIPLGEQETEQDANITSITELNNGYQIAFNSNLYSGSSYSNDYPRAQRFALVVTSISTNNQIKTKAYPINYNKSVITNSNVDESIYQVIDENTYTYFMHTMSGTTFTLKFNIEFTNQRVAVKSLEVFAY